MKILIISDNFPPEVNAPATRTWEHCRRWVEQGAEVTVITCAPNFPQGKVYPGYRNRLYQRETVDGINVIRVWSFITANEGFVKRVLDYLSFAFTAFWAGLFQKCDVIIATSPQFFTTLPGFALSVLKRRPWIFELRDLWPESIAAVGAMEESRLLRWFERLELFMYRRAARVIAVTEAFKHNLVRRGIDADKVHVITNGVDREKFRPIRKDAELLSELGLEGKFVYGYIGTHGMAHGLEFIAESLAHLDDPNIHFLFVGGGAYKKTVLEIADRLRLKNATFLDPVPKEEVPRYLSIMDAALVPLRRSDTFKTVIPSKIFECAAMEKPILLGVDGQAREIVEEYNAGLFFMPEDRDAFIGEAKRLASDKELYQDLQSGCRALARAYDRTRLADELLEIVKWTQ